MNKTFLSDLVVDSPIAVFRNRVYEVCDSSSDASIYLSIGNAVKGLRESEMLIHFENSFMAEKIQKELETARKRQENDRKGWKDKISNIKTSINRTRVEQFLEEFLNSWSHSAHIPKRTPISKKINIDDYIIAMPSKLDFHLENARTPVISDVFGSRLVGFLFMDGLAYIFSEAKANDASTHIVAGDRIFELTYKSTIQEFEDVYLPLLQAKFKDRIKYLELAQTKEFEKLNKKYHTSQSSDAPLPQENRNKQVGWLKDGTDYYVYAIKPSFVIMSHALKKKFRFPSCKIGLRLIIKGDSISYDTNQNSGMARILESRQVAAGRETGKMQNLKNKDYLHPATKLIADHINKYTYLCMGTYDFERPSTKKTLIDCINKVLRDACNKIEKGYRDHAYKGSDVTLFRYLDKDYESFKNLEVK
jgi:hypothetical protein